MKRIIHQNIKIILVSWIVAILLLFGLACSKPYVRNRIKSGMSYEDAANARIKQIKKLCKGNRVQSVPEQHSLYLMEMGMIEDFVFERTLESEVLYEEAVNKNPANCDARLLLTAKYSEQASKRNPEKIYKGLKVITESVCPKSTLTNFYKAKLNIFEGDDTALTAARKDLEELYVSRLGDTGITKKDILSLIIYGYLKEQNFREAKIRFEEAGNAEILPQVKALMLIGNHDFNKLKELKNNKAVQEFLVRDLDKTMNPPSSIEKVFLKTEVDLKPDETKPEETKNDEYGETKLERDVAAIIDSSDKDLVKRFLDKRNNNVINLKEKLNRLQKMKTSYLKAAINNALGMARDNEMSKARTDYIKAYKMFDDQAIELAKTLDSSEA